tara:strand:- start:19 stop:201 length:183 start_codon:yes stop_codon:yes gene_type:complete
MDILILFWFAELMLWIGIILMPFALLELYILNKEKVSKTEIEIWTEQYQADVPTVWTKTQ